MGPDCFVKVFDIAASGFKDWQFSAFGLIFVVIGTAIFFAPAYIPLLGVPWFYFPSKGLTVFRYFALGFALFWTTTAFLATYNPYIRHRDLAERNACTVVEGPVTNFVPMPRDGHGDESFSVSGVEFRYSDYEASDAFNNTASHGGPLGKGAYVRICYDPSDNAILRLEIRDFHKTPRDYTRGDSVFDDSAEADRRLLPARQGDAAWVWLGDIWVSLCVLDVFLTVGMVLPYLRTFWRLKSVPLAATAIPSWLERGRKIKLRNTLALWDATRGTIWLRPRGFNFLRVPLGVAKLSIDPQLHVLTGCEIRCSFAMPIVVVLFLFSAFEMFSAEEARPTAPLFILGLLFLLTAVLYARRLISRMRMLVQDALEEFASTHRGSA